MYSSSLSVSEQKTENGFIPASVSIAMVASEFTFPKISILDSILSSNGGSPESLVATAFGYQFINHCSH